MTDDQAVAVDPAERGRRASEDAAFRALLGGTVFAPRPEEHPTARPAVDDGGSTSTAHCRIALYYED